MLVSIIIVNYNSGGLLAECLRSVMRAPADFDYEKIVVDNASSDDSLDRARSACESASYIKNDANVGFARANNIGIQSSHGSFILLLNPDTVVLGDSLNRLVDTIREDAAVGIVSGRLLNSDGTLQYSLRRFPTVVRCASEAFFLHKVFPGTNATSGEMLVENSCYDQSRDVDWLCGAVMLVRRAAVDDVGLFDESFFLYSEEVDWCYRMNARGWRVAYTPDARFIHHIGRAQTEPALYNRQLRSRRQFNYKHYGPITARLLDIISLLYVVNRALYYTVTNIVKPSPDMRYMRTLHLNSGFELLRLITKGLLKGKA